MWFKNLRVYRLTREFTLSAEQLNELLEPDTFTPCGSQDMARYGWVLPSWWEPWPMAWPQLCFIERESGAPPQCCGVCGAATNPSPKKPLLDQHT